MLKMFIKSQKWLSRQFDRLLSGKFRLDGQTDYQENIVPAYLEKGMLIYDIGGGKRPYLNPGDKERLKAEVVGLDISAEELDKAPEGAYDQKVCADIAGYTGNGNANLILCQSLLEHVCDIEAAFNAFHSILKPGGLALVFVPSRNALFARLNLFIPQALKRTLLHTLYPKSKEIQGFPAYYHKCTPRDLKHIAAANNFSVLEEFYYYNSVYFRFFFPFHLLWRLWILVYYLFSKEQSAETFTLVLKKQKIRRKY